MKMSEQQCVDPANGQAKLEQPHGGAAPGIDQDDVITRLNQCAWTKTIGPGDWRPGPEQCDPKRRCH